MGSRNGPPRRRSPLLVPIRNVPIMYIMLNNGYAPQPDAKLGVASQPSEPAQPSALGVRELAAGPVPKVARATRCPQRRALVRSTADPSAQHRGVVVARLPAVVEASLAMSAAQRCLVFGRELPRTAGRWNASFGAGPTAGHGLHVELGGGVGRGVRSSGRAAHRGQQRRTHDDAEEGSSGHSRG